MRHENNENRPHTLLKLLAIPAGLEPATRGVEIHGAVLKTFSYSRRCRRLVAIMRRR
jgi:hypothetical protein